MKFLKNKKVYSKLIIIIVFVTILSFCVPTTVKADEERALGKLLKPVVSLLIGIGDGAMDIIHKTIYGQADSTMTVDTESEWWEVFWTFVVGVVTVVVVAAVIVFLSGGVAAALAAIGVTSLTTVSVGTVLLVSTGTGVAAAAVFNSNVFPDDLKLPIYQISPEEIFSNEIPLFDVDFFNPAEEISAKVEEVEVEETERILPTTEDNSSYYYILSDGTKYKNNTYDGSDDLYKIKDDYEIIGEAEPLDTIASEAFYFMDNNGTKYLVELWEHSSYSMKCRKYL